MNDTVARHHNNNNNNNNNCDNLILQKNHNINSNENNGQSQNYSTKNTYDSSSSTLKKKNTFEPSVFGPPFWFTLHNGACKYPVDASDFYAERMKGFILGIPIMVPCEKCKIDSYEYIESNKYMLDDVCKHRSNLKKFFIDFHNHVNIKLGKPTLSYEEVDKIYN